jgi:carboxyl-terminal processing protease
VPFGQTEPKDFVLHRERIHSDSIEGDYYDSDRRSFCLEAHPKIGYIWITSFSGTTALEFGNALERMMQNGAESFILDLRDNSGGDVWNCIQIAQMLMNPDSVAGNTIVTVKDRHGTERLRHRHFVLVEGAQRCTLPMVVLINDDSASSSEILAAALQDHHRATIVGTRSFGKGIIQCIIELPFHSGILQLTDSEYRRPNGSPIHHQRNAADSDAWGVIPDQVVALSETEQAAVMTYRMLRSNVISPGREAVLEQFRHHVAQQIAEDETAEQKEFAFPGTAPYYDPQLDEAVKVLER